MKHEAFFRPEPFDVYTAIGSLSLALAIFIAIAIIVIVRADKGVS